MMTLLGAIFEFFWPEVKMSDHSRWFDAVDDERYRGTSLIRNSAPLGPYSRTMPRALWGS